MSLEPVRGSRDAGIVGGPNKMNENLLPRAHNRCKFAGNAFGKRLRFAHRYVFLRSG